MQCLVAIFTVCLYDALSPRDTPLLPESLQTPIISPAFKKKKQIEPQSNRFSEVHPALWASQLQLLKAIFQQHLEQQCSQPHWQGFHSKELFLLAGERR